MSNHAGQIQAVPPIGSNAQHDAVARVVLFQKHILVQSENGVEPNKEGVDLALAVLLAQLPVQGVHESGVHFVEHLPDSGLQAYQRIVVNVLVSESLDLELGKRRLESAMLLVPKQELP
jgi:hypothetical protein